MKKTRKTSILFSAILLLAALAGSSLATENPTSAVILDRIFNDSFASVLTVDNSFPALISVDDQCAGPLGWANLHAWRFSTDDMNPHEFANTDGFIFGADVTLSGTGDGESGLQVAPWWSQADGRFNIRTPDGEVACFGGRLPFYSFTASQGVSYVKGTTVRLTVIYRPNIEMDASSPATIEYLYDDGTEYSSGPLPFDEGNPAEDPPHGLWGILSPAYAGGHVQFNNMVGAGDGANLQAEWANIAFEDLGTVVATEQETWGGVKALFR